MDALPPALDPRLRRRAEAGAAWVRAQRNAGRTVTVVHHIDADGVSAGAIAATALERSGVPFRTLAVKSMDAVHQEKVRSEGTGALWLCDLGSTVYMHFPGTERLVCDHHQLVRDGSEESFPHVNPLLDGLPGESVSGAGCTYLVAAALGAENLDLLPLALVGASADLQDRREGRFTGTNETLAAHGAAAGLLETRRDVAFFGPETRPLRKFLALGEPAVPTATGDQRTAEAFLLSAGVEVMADGAERTWSLLTEAERCRLRSLLVERLLDCGLAERVPSLWREVISFRNESPGSPTREPREFGTLLNSTARYGRPEVGLAVARGDRDAAYAEALDLLTGHRRNLASSLEAFAQAGVEERTAIQVVHVGDRVLDTVVGIVAGMALSALGLARDKALVAFAHTPDGRTKVSTRSPHELEARGIDLATAVREAAEAVGGQGGGHRGAAGATIPRGSEEAFAAAVDRIVAHQVGLSAPAPTPSRFAPPKPSRQAKLAPDSF